MPSISSIVYAYYRLINNDKNKVIDSSTPIVNPRKAFYVAFPDCTRDKAGEMRIYVADRLRYTHNLEASFQTLIYYGEFKHGLISFLRSW